MAEGIEGLTEVQANDYNERISGSVIDCKVAMSAVVVDPVGRNANLSVKEREGGERR